jgi:hypothetical protein
MEITKMTYGGGDSWAAASARLRLVAPRPFAAGVEVCPQRDDALGMTVVTFNVKTFSGTKFGTDKHCLGSPVLRPPV